MHRHHVQKQWLAMLLCCLFAIVVSSPGAAQTPVGVVPITAEPEHKIRFDNGRVRMYEVLLPKDRATQVHEHRADSFAVNFGAAEITNEFLGGKAVVLHTTPGTTSFTSTAQGPYSHRVIASGDSTFHVIAMELLSRTPAATRIDMPRPGPAFAPILQNARGRAWRISLAPGESTGSFTRPAGTAVFAITGGRISEFTDGKPARLWDFEPAYFRWYDASEQLSVRNDGPTPIELVEVEVF